MYWGKTGVTSESNGTAIFSAANGFASVMHLNETLTDVLGNTAPTNNGTTVGAGQIGKGRHFVAGQGVDCGQNITTFPSGGASHSTSLWVKSDSVNWASLVRWGKVQDSGQVELELSPAPTTTANMNGFWSGATIHGTTAVTPGQWTHVAYTYNNSAGKLYVNGVLDGTGFRRAVAAKSGSDVPWPGMAGRIHIRRHHGRGSHLSGRSFRKLGETGI